MSHQFQLLRPRHLSDDAKANLSIAITAVAVLIGSALAYWVAQ